jgi:Fic family protein
MKINTPTPQFNSRLTDLILALENLRNHDVARTTEPWTFVQLKELFHIVEALSSARIEGNHTTLAAYVEAEAKNAEAITTSEQLAEITNLRKALAFIDQNIADTEINRGFLQEIHKIVVGGLTREGDKRAGAWRSEPRRIADSGHVLPMHFDIPDLMRDFFAYLNEPSPSKEDLLKTAIAHHRFVWIHPFGNGNGRTVRLLTYAMLCKYGFITPNTLRLYNPTAVFMADRQKYYEMLGRADDLSERHMLDWCEYFLGGLQTEIEKTKRLADVDFVKNQILSPAIAWAYEYRLVTNVGRKILDEMVEKNVIKADDVKQFLPDDTSNAMVSKHLRKLKDARLIRPVKEGGRAYVINFIGNELTRAVLGQMEKQGMLPVRVDDFSQPERSE